MSKGRKRFADASAAEEMLRRNGVVVGVKAILISVTPGLKMWSAIDYLCNHEGYTYARVEKK